MDFFISFVVGLFVDLMLALFVFLIFSVVGIPFLAELSYWQVFGLTVATQLATTKVNLD